MDCSGGDLNFGCDGGVMEFAFLYIMENQGIASEAVRLTEHCGLPVCGTECEVVVVLRLVSCVIYSYMQKYSTLPWYLISMEE